MGTADQNKSIVRRFIEEVCNQRKLDVADELFATHHAYHDPSIPKVGPGAEGMKQVVATYQKALPDAHWAIEEIVAAEADIVVTRWRGRGTHKNELQGIPPTGKQVNVEGIFFQRLANNKISETIVVWDSLGMLQQLGVVPQMAQTARLQPEKKN
jgi:steroid delta-isomerase-like uncharacterized protein